MFHRMRKIKAIVLYVVLAVSPIMFAAVPVYAQTDIQNGLCAGTNLQFTDSPSSASCSTSDATARINKIIHTVINLFSAIVGIVAVVMIIVGGLRYITSGGNDTSVTSAKNTLLYAVIGLIIVALAQVIVRFTLNKITNS